MGEVDSMLVILPLLAPVNSLMYAEKKGKKKLKINIPKNEIYAKSLSQK